MEAPYMGLAADGGGMQRSTFRLAIRAAAAVGCAIAGVAEAEDRTFLMTPQVCQMIGGSVVISVEKEDYYTQIVGPRAGQPSQMCVAGWFGARTCADVILYNFSVVCRGGVASAPALYMALFGGDKETANNGAMLSGGRLSYIEQSKDLYQRHPRRVAFPTGYAPFQALESRLRSLEWDMAAGHPVLSRAITEDQRARIKALFVTRSGYVEPFPVSAVARAAGVSEERPKVPESNMAPPSRGSPQPQQDSPRAGSPSQIREPKPVDPAVVYLLVAGAIALLVYAIKKQVPIKSLQGAVVVATVASIISSVVLYWLGMKEGITLFSTTVFWVLVFSITLFS